jgi:hypothetical protein
MGSMMSLGHNDAADGGVQRLGASVGRGGLVEVFAGFGEGVSGGVDD